MTTLRGVFGQLDGNGDSAINKSEVKAYVEEAGVGGGILGGVMVSQATQEILSAFDTNRDGKITWDEFCANSRGSFFPTSIFGNGPLGAAVHAWEASADVSHADKMLTVDEARVAFKKAFDAQGVDHAKERADVSAKLLVHVVDENKDGRASFEELDSLALEIEKQKPIAVA